MIVFYSRKNNEKCFLILTEICTFLRYRTNSILSQLEHNYENNHEISHKQRPA